METVSESRTDILDEGKYSRTRLFFATFAVYSLHFSTGAVIAWPSPMIPRLNLSDSENALVSSLFSLGAAPGPIITTFGIDSIGRKATLFVSSAAFLISWILLIFSQNITVIYLARVIGGIGIGGSFSGVSVYVAEIADDATRGPLGSFLQTFLAVGFLVEYCVGPYVSFTLLAVVNLLLGILFVIFFYFVPESPHYLIAKGKIKEAYSALIWLRGNVSEDKIQREISMIQEGLKKEKQSVTGIKKLFTSCAVFKGMGIGILLIMMQQGSGINAVLAYVQLIFENANLHLDAVTVPILLGLTNLFASLPAPLLVKWFGNKVTFVISSLGSGVFLCLLGLYFYLVDQKYDTTYLGALSVVSIILFNIFFCLGLGPLVWSAIAEIFSSSVKAMAMGVCGVFSAIFGFFAIEVFSTVLHTYGFYTVFFGFGVYLLIGGLCILLFVPNTSRMTLQQIQDYLENK
uniref:Sugar transporter n=1 Tax=Riptortus pedestris TaxID=329032 RepID=R4WPC0_RIPPE|nr:sugar transporter [Riptortus pedestris]